MAEIQLYDCTLREGAQQEGISFSLEDKIKITKSLDELGVHYIEGGYPGSNPKDAEFFVRVRNLGLKNATITAFGSTRRAAIAAENDANLRALLDTKAPVITLVGKSSLMQVTKVIETTPEEGIAMVADSVRFLKSKGRKAFFDAEHFFDGYKYDADYSRRAVQAAVEAGADCVILCDTNGGTLTEDLVAAIRDIKANCNVPLGIHVHNDTELAVANTLAAVREGFAQVQGTANGYGERCGNANLFTMIPTLKLKMGHNCVTDAQLARVTETARYISEIANRSLDPHTPYIGTSAFAHKAGLHVAAIMKNEDTYQHVNPVLVGNQRRVVVSELSGRGTIVYKAQEKGLDLGVQGDKARAIIEHVKSMESKGFQYEGAEASFDLLLRRAQADYTPPFELVDFLVVVEKRRRSSTIDGEELLSEAMVKVRVGEDVMHTVAEGNGPVNALDAALRKALMEFFPSLAAVKLTDYKVRILEESVGTGSLVRVLIESSDGEDEWRTVGSSTNIIEASWLALADSLEYWLLKQAGNGSATG